MGSMGSSRLGKADESPLFQMSQAPVLAGKCPPPMADSRASQTRTAPWRRVTSTPCQTLRAIRTSSGPRYFGLVVLFERAKSSGAKYNFSNTSISFIYIYFSSGGVKFLRELFIFLFLFIYLFFKHLYWGIIALQWCVSFCCITK